MKRNLLIGTSLVAAVLSSSIEARYVATTQAEFNESTKRSDSYVIAVKQMTEETKSDSQPLKATEPTLLASTLNTEAGRKIVANVLKTTAKGEQTADALITEFYGQTADQKKKTIEQIALALAKNVDLRTIAETFRPQVVELISGKKAPVVAPAPVVTPAPVEGMELPGVVVNDQEERAIAENALTAAVKAVEAAQKKVDEFKATEDAVTNAQADLKKAETDLKEAKARLVKLEEKVKSEKSVDVLPKGQFESAQKTVKACEAAVEKAKKDLETADKAWKAVKEDKAKADKALIDAKEAKATAEKNLAEAKRSPEEKKGRATAEQINNLKAEIERLKKANALVSEAEVREAEASAATLDAKIVEASQALNTARATLEGAADAANRAELEKAAKETAEKLAGLEKAKQEKVAAAAALKARFEAANSEAALKAKLLEAQAAGNQEAVNTLTAKLKADEDAKSREVNALIAKLNAAEDAKSREVNALIAKLNAAEDALAAVNAEAAEHVPAKVWATFVAEKETALNKAREDLLACKAKIDLYAEKIVVDQDERGRNVTLAEHFQLGRSLGDVRETFNREIQEKLGGFKANLARTEQSIAESENPAGYLNDAKRRLEAEIQSLELKQAVVKAIEDQTAITDDISRLEEILAIADGIDLTKLTPVAGTEGKASAVLAAAINARLKMTLSFVSSIRSVAVVGGELKVVEDLRRDLNEVIGQLTSFPELKELLDLDLSSDAGEYEEGEEAASTPAIEARNALIANVQRELLAVNNSEASDLAAIIVKSVDSWRANGVQDDRKVTERLQHVSGKLELEKRSITVVDVKRIFERLAEAANGVEVATQFDEEVNNLTGQLSKSEGEAVELNDFIANTTDEINALRAQLSTVDEGARADIETQIQDKDNTLVRANDELARALRESVVLKRSLGLAQARQRELSDKIRDSYREKTHFSLRTHGGEVSSNLTEATLNDLRVAFADFSFLLVERSRALENGDLAWLDGEALDEIFGAAQDDDGGPALRGSGEVELAELKDRHADVDFNDLQNAMSKLHAEYQELRLLNPSEQQTQEKLNALRSDYENLRHMNEVVLERKLSFDRDLSDSAVRVLRAVEAICPAGSEHSRDSTTRNDGGIAPRPAGEQTPSSEPPQASTTGNDGGMVPPRPSQPQLGSGNNSASPQLTREDVLRIAQKTEEGTAALEVMVNRLKAGRE